MKVFICEKDRNRFVRELDGHLKECISKAVSLALAQQDYGSNDYINGVNNALESRVCDLEDTIDIEYLPEKLTFFTFNNLRCQQDGVPSEVKRFENLQDAIKEYNSLPKEYTTALGGYLGETNCIDFIHRRNGESVLVNDFKKIEDWSGNGLVMQAINSIIGQLGVEYESDISSLGYQCPVLVPVSFQNRINSYFQDKYLRPDDEKTLLSAINEVFVEGNGWVEAKKFFNDLDKIAPSRETYRPKVTKYNVNYVDLNGHCGQADISPADFAMLKKQTEERSAKHPEIDSQIKDAAAKVDKPDVSVQKDIEHNDR